jgi:hypothetical protein
MTITLSQSSNSLDRDLTSKAEEQDMSNAQQAAAFSGTFERSGRQSPGISEGLRVVSMWSLLGLTVSALAIASGFGAELGQILLIAG